MSRTPIQIARGFVLYVENIELPRIGRVDVIRKLDLQTGEEITLLDDNLSQFRANIFNWRLSGTTLYFSGQNLRNNDTVLGELDLLAIRDGASAESALRLQISATASGAVAQVQDIEVLRPVVPTQDVGGSPRVRIDPDVITGKSVSLSFTKYMDKETLESRLLLTDSDGDAIDYMPMWLLQTLHMVPDLDSFDQISSQPLAQSSEYTLEFSPGVRDLWTWDLNLAESAGVVDSAYRFNTMGPKFVALANSSLNGRPRPDFGNAFSARNVLSFRDLEPRTSLNVPFLTPLEFSSLGNFRWEFGYWSDGLENNGSVQFWGDNGEHIVVIFKEGQIVLKYVDDQGVDQLATSRLFNSSQHQARYGWNRLRITRLNGNYIVDHAKGDDSWRRLSFLKGHRLVNEIEGTRFSASSDSASIVVTSASWGSSIDLAGLRLMALNQIGENQSVLVDLDQFYTGTRVAVENHTPSTMRELSADRPTRLGQIYYHSASRDHQVGHMAWVPPDINGVIRIEHRSCCSQYIAPVPGVRDIKNTEKIDDFKVSFWIYPRWNSQFLFGNENYDIFEINFMNNSVDVSYLSTDGWYVARSSESVKSLHNEWIFVEAEVFQGDLSIKTSIRGGDSVDFTFLLNDVEVDSLPIRRAIDFVQPHAYLTGQDYTYFSGLSIERIGSSGSMMIFDMNELSLDAVDHSSFTFVNARDFRPNVTISADGMGEIRLRESPRYNEPIILDILPEDEYSVVEISGCEGFQSGENGYATANLRSPCEIQATFEPSFQLHENGVTVLCPHAPNGASGTINASGEGPRYTRRSRDQITPANAALTCTTGIQSMSWLFNGQEAFNANIRSWDTSSVIEMSHMFHNASSFNQDIGIWDTSEVRDFSGMFLGASTFNQPIGSWETSTSDSLSRMFHNASSFNQDVSGWITSSVTRMDQLFDGATVFNQAIGNWDTRIVTTMHRMFGGTSFAHDISDWDTSAVTDMGYMFLGNGSFNHDIGGWKTGSVVDMRGMFFGASSFNQDISGWNTGSVTRMDAMFREAISFNSDISDWNTGSVIRMDHMFYQARAFNKPIGSWSTSSVINMEHMFFEAEQFDQDISNWQTASVTNMRRMFFNAKQFSQGIGSWNTNSVSNMSGMFEFALSFNDDIGAWRTNNVVDMSRMFDGATSFNRNLSAWCVKNITTKPERFDHNTPAWVGSDSTRPQWGQDCN